MNIMKTIAFAWLIIIQSSLPLLGTDNPWAPLRDLHRLPQMKREIQAWEDEKRQMDGWDALLADKSRPLDESLRLVLEDARKKAGWSDVVTKKLHEILLPYAGIPPGQVQSTGSIVMDLHKRENQKMELVLAGFDQRAKPEAWKPIHNVEFVQYLSLWEFVQIQPLITFLKNIEHFLIQEVATKKDYDGNPKPGSKKVILAPSRTLDFLRHRFEDLNENMLKTRAAVFATINPINNTQYELTRVTMRYFDGLEYDQALIVRRLATHFIKDETYQQSSQRSSWGLLNTISSFAGLDMERTQVIVYGLLAKCGDRKWSWETEKLIPIVKALVPHPITNISACFTAHDKLSEEDWEPQHVVSLMECLAPLTVEGIRATENGRQMIGKHEDWSVEKRLEFFRFFASVPLNHQTEIVPAVKSLDPKQQLGPYHLEDVVKTLKSFANPQDIRPLSEKCAQKGTTPKARCSLLEGYASHTGQDFMDLLEMMPFKVSHKDEGENITVFLSLIPKALWPAQLKIIAEERVKTKNWKDRLIVAFNTPALRVSIETYWTALLMNPKLPFINFILGHAKELGLDPERDGGFFHMVIDANPDKEGHFLPFCHTAYGELVKEKRKPIDLRSVPCPLHTVGNVSVRLNAPHMSEVGRLLARDLSSSLNVTYAQFLAYLGAMEQEVTKTTTIKAWFADKRARRLFKNERGDRNRGSFEFKEFRHGGCFHEFLLNKEFRKFLRQYVAGTVKDYQHIKIIADGREFTVYANDLAKVVVSLKFYAIKKFSQNPDFQDLFVHHETNILGAQWRCILRHIVEQEDAPLTEGALSDRTRELVDILLHFEEPHGPSIQRRYLALKPGQKLRAKKDSETVEAVQETFCDVAEDLLDVGGPFVVPLIPRYYPNLGEAIAYYYKALLSPHVGFLSSLPNRTAYESCIGKYYPWDKLSLPHALQKFYELLTPEYVVVKIRERMLKNGQASAEELTDEMLVNKLIEAKIFEAFQANSLPG